MAEIGWFGLGKVGLPCAEVFAKNGHSVCGYDLNKVLSNSVKVVDDPKLAVSGKQFVFIAVQTPHKANYSGNKPISHLPRKGFKTNSVKKCLKTINKYATKDTIIVLISTVLPGTVRSKFSKLLSKGKLIYNPYLIGMGSVAYDMVNPDIVIVGAQNTKNQEVLALKNLYETVMNNKPYYSIGTWEEAETTKIFYNTFISARLSLVNMIQDVAQRVGNMNVDVITKSLSMAHYRSNGEAYNKAGMGDGGLCHPRDNIATSYLAKKLKLGYDLFGEVAKSREIQAENMAKEILKYGKRIAFSNDTYKSGVDITEGSYSLLVQHYVKKHGGHITIHSADVIVRVHPDDFIIANNQTTVFDPWRSYTSSDPNAKIVHYGKTYDTG